MKKGPGRNARSGKRNAPGSKIARKAIEHAGREWKGEVFHGGELTKANKARARKRLGFL